MISDEQTGTSSPLPLNKVFAKNLMKQAHDHNRIKDVNSSLRRRKFENEERKKVTTRSLKKTPFKSSDDNKTMYCDFVAGGSVSAVVAKRSKIISPFDQVKKLVNDAAAYDKLADRKLSGGVSHNSVSHMVPPARSSLGRVTLDKRLIKSHLQQASVHNRLKEEQEMWDIHVEHLKRKISSDSGLSSRSGRLERRHGTMYSDRESRPKKLVRERHRVDTSLEPVIGPWTQKLLEFEENDEERWDHSGYKTLYGTSTNNSSSASKKSKVKRAKIVISETETESDEPDRNARKNHRLSRGSRNVAVMRSRRADDNRTADGEWVERVVVMTESASPQSSSLRSSKRKRQRQEAVDNDVDAEAVGAYREPSVKSLALKLGTGALTHVVTSSSDEGRESHEDARQEKSPPHANAQSRGTSRKLPDEVSRHSLLFSIHKQGSRVGGNRSVVALQSSVAGSPSLAKPITGITNPEDLRSKVLSKRGQKKDSSTRQASDSSSLSDSEDDDDLALRKELLRKRGDY